MPTDDINVPTGSEWPPAVEQASGGVSALVWGGNGLTSAAGRVWMQVGGGYQGGLPLDGSLGAIVIPCDGILRRMYARHGAAAGNGNGVSYVLVVNSADTALSVSIPTGAVIEGSNLVDEVPVSQGDLVAIAADKAMSIGSAFVWPHVTLAFEAA